MSNILNDEFESFKADLINAYNAKGMRASGKFERSLEVIQPSETKIQLWGEDYAQQLETGRLAGKFPPLAPIKEWIEEKGIAARIEGQISISSLAYLIARKIARSGWKREGYGGVELISEVVTTRRMQSIIDKVGETQIITFSNQIVGFLNQIELK